MEAYHIHIQGLSNSLHHFTYELGEAFFKQFGTGLLDHGNFTATVSLDKHETFIEASFHLEGTAQLECDRSLECFDYPITADEKIIFKFGAENQEISEDVIMIQRNTDTLKLGPYLMEFIGLAIPMKKLHPRFAGEANDQDAIVYTSGGQTNQEEEIDPRWEALKKLNKN